MDVSVTSAWINVPARGPDDLATDRRERQQSGSHGATSDPLRLPGATPRPHVPAVAPGCLVTLPSRLPAATRRTGSATRRITFRLPGRWEPLLLASAGAFSAR